MTPAPTIQLHARLPRSAAHARQLHGAPCPLWPERRFLQVHLGKTLIQLSAAGQSAITLDELAEPFSPHILEHLARAPRQATSSSSRFPDACRKFKDGSLDRDELIGTTVKLGFNNVIDAFHVVNRDDISVRFYVDERKSGGGIRLTDELLRLRETVQFGNLPHEVEARWRLVESAWQLEMSRNSLAVDVDA